VDLEPVRRDREFRMLWLGQLVNGLGRQVTVVALPFELWQLTHSSLSIGLLAIVQYSFLGVNPATSCPSIGLLAHLVRNAEKWDARDEYLLETTHHDSLQRIDVLDFAGDGAHELLIESKYGGAGMAASSLQVFDLRRGRFEELLNVDSRLQYWGESSYTQALDMERTRQSHGQQFCFTKSTTFEQGDEAQTPRVTNPCYGIGEGVDFTAAADRNKRLAPAQ